MTKLVSLKESAEFARRGGSMDFIFITPKGNFTASWIDPYLGCFEVPEVFPNKACWIDTFEEGSVFAEIEEGKEQV